MYRSFKILVLPSLLTLAIVAAAVMGLMNYLSRDSLETTYLVKNMQQDRPCQLCHDGSFAPSALRIAWLPCEALTPTN